MSQLPNLNLAIDPLDDDELYQLNRAFYKPLELVAALYADLNTLSDAGYKISES